MDLLIETLSNDSAASRPPKPLAAELSRWANERGVRADAATALRAVLTWSRLHGFVSLEIAGNYESMSINPDQLFEAELSEIAS
jgi:hypothetical protein